MNCCLYRNDLVISDGTAHAGVVCRLEVLEHRKHGRGYQFRAVVIRRVCPSFEYTPVLHHRIIFTRCGEMKPWPSLLICLVFNMRATVA